MAIRTSGIIPGLGPSDFVAMKNQLGDLQRQIGTGRKGESYGALGNDRGLALSYRASMTSIQSWRQTIGVVTTRISLIDTSLKGVGDVATSGRKAFRSDDPLISGGLTQGQVAASSYLDQTLDFLNARVDGRYLMGGRKTDSPPVEDRSVFMNGTSTKAGFVTTMRERVQADLGSSSFSPESDATATGRVVLSASATQPVTLAEDGVHSFGLKIDSVSGGVGGTAASVAAGPPKTLSIATAAGNAVPGETLSIGFKLPDGSVERIDLRAVGSDVITLGPGEFRPGATPTATLQAMRDTLGTELQKMIGSKLAAASAAQAGEDFFKGETNAAALAGPPVIESGVPKRLVAGASGTMKDAVAFDTPANADAKTVRWYKGDRSTGDPRSTATARVDLSVNVNYGVRADEEGTRRIVQTLAVASATSFSATDPNARARYNALITRTQGGLVTEGLGASVINMRAEISTALSTAKSADERHSQAKGVFADLLDNIEGVKSEDVAAQLLALQTRLQASYQTSAMLSRLSIVSYL